MSKTVSYTEARNHLKQYLDYVTNNNDIVTIQRKDGRNVILITEEDYNALDETDYLLSNSKTKERLLESIKNIEEGNMEGSVTFNSTEEMREYFENDNND